MADSSVPPRPPRPRNPLRVALRFAFRVVVGIVILLDELVRPLYRPLLDWLAALKLVQRFEAWVGGLPAYAVLVLIAVPYGVVEPVKFLALIHIANGHVRTGTFLFLLAHLVSFVLIERIFPGPVYFLASLALYLGNFVFVYAAMAGALDRGTYGLVKYALLSPLYWALMSIAAWKGVLQLIYAPSYWEKTTHGLATPSEDPLRGVARASDA